jgi:pimeloyl-ACP methyl ester carboxylesterase
MRAIKDCIARSMPAPIASYRALTRPLIPAIRRHLEAARPERRTRVPLLYLAGAQDGCVSATLGRNEERFFAGPYKREVLPGVGHFMHLERPDDIASRVIAWFDEARTAVP